MPMNRQAHLTSFYALLDELTARVDGPHVFRLAPLRDWPGRGVYFFFEPEEIRRESGAGLRVVRVGTHALTHGSLSSLKTRLTQHRGAQKSGSGNHRGSVFRLLIGAALLERRLSNTVPTWGKGSSAPAAVRSGERDLEQAVSARLAQMSVVALEVADEPGPESQRSFIERNAIALLSNCGKAALDAPSPDWLGLHCPRPRVRSSGLWNQNHVEETYDPGFLSAMKELIERTARVA